MAKYLKLFNTHTNYTSYINGDNVFLPNVSYCETENEVHYNPIDNRLIATYTVEDASETTQLYYYYVGEEYEEYWVRGIDMFDKVEIDGVEVSVSSLDTAEGYYQLSVGEHTVAYTLKDPTTIGDSAFNNCYALTSIRIPSGVTTIGYSAFAVCDALTSVVLPNSVRSICEGAFNDCQNLSNLTIGNNVTTIGEYAFSMCTSLTHVDIPSSVTTIGYSAFGCLDQYLLDASTSVRLNFLERLLNV